ncbi:family 20 glycosylhydrolase [Halosquirtibacter laminarini]|uniref:Family 20 glycosylhydrolase n=1 Tax=Halosquirtibacter laminarini TaxID=3374600 RepID=A0AC61NFU5_9BACT|nr:family 20 glycosylhydrolase [Prolixibacteraceae bacterium]
MKHLLRCVLLILLFSGCQTESTNKKLYSIIPSPFSVTNGEGYFTLGDNITYKSNSAFILLQEKELSRFIHGYCNVKISKAPSFKDADIKITYDRKLGFAKDAYSLKISDDGINIKAGDTGGIIYAITTLRQLVKVDKKGNYCFPCVYIRDKPTYSNRMFRLDVSKRYMPTLELKKIMDYMAFSKMNKLILVLGKGENLRLNLPSFPNLNSHPKESYSHNDISNLIHYAKRRNITIIPEVDLFFDNEMVKSHYPQYCDYSSYDDAIDKTDYHVKCYLNITDQMVHKFVTKVYDEVTTLFSAKNICIGNVRELEINSEVGESSLIDPKRDELIDKYNENLSLLLKKIDADFYAKGIELIFMNDGWKYSDRKNALSIVTQSTAASYLNLKKGMRVVEAPITLYNLDKPQNLSEMKNGIHESELVTLNDVYEFNPHVEGNFIDKNDVVGSCALMDASKSSSFDEMTTKIFPRLLAISDRGWMGTNHTNWNRFREDIFEYEKLLSYYHVEYGQLSRVVYSYNDFNEAGQLVLHMFNEDGSPIHFTLDGRTPTTMSPMYEEPIVIDNDYDLKACSFDKNDNPGVMLDKHFLKHLGIHRYITVKYPFSKLDGSGGGMNISDGYTRLFQRMDLSDVDVSMDLGGLHPLSKLSSNWLVDLSKGAFMPSSVTYMISTDGKSFKTIFKEVYEQEIHNRTRHVVNVSCFPKGTKARYIRLIAKNLRIVPMWHEKRGDYASIYVDELIVE